MGPQVQLAVGWIGLDQLFGGLGWVWVDEMDPRTTLCPTISGWLLVAIVIIFSVRVIYFIFMHLYQHPVG